MFISCLTLFLCQYLLAILENVIKMKQISTSSFNRLDTFISFLHIIISIMCGENHNLINISNKSLISFILRHCFEDLIQFQGTFNFGTLLHLLQNAQVIQFSYFQFAFKCRLIVTCIIPSFHIICLFLYPNDFIITRICNCDLRQWDDKLQRHYALQQAVENGGGRCLQ